MRSESLYGFEPLMGAFRIVWVFNFTKGRFRSTKGHLPLYHRSPTALPQVAAYGRLPQVAFGLQHHALLMPHTQAGI